MDPTIQESYIKWIKIDDKEVKLEILDPNCYDEYEFLIEKYIRSSDGFIYVIDFEKKETIECLYRTIERLKLIHDKDRFPLVLFFNKSDLKENEKNIKEDDIQKVINKLENELKYKLPYFCGSAKYRLNIDDAFYEIIHEINKNKKK